MVARRQLMFLEGRKFWRNQAQALGLRRTFQDNQGQALGLGWGFKKNQGQALDLRQKGEKPRGIWPKYLIVDLSPDSIVRGSSSLHNYIFQLNADLEARGSKTGREGYFDNVLS